MYIQFIVSKLLLNAKKPMIFKYKNKNTCLFYCGSMNLNKYFIPI